MPADESFGPITRRKKWDGTEAVPPMNFNRFLAGKNVQVAPKKGPPFLDTRARMRRQNCF